MIDANYTKRIIYNEFDLKSIDKNLTPPFRPLQINFTHLSTKPIRPPHFDFLQ